MTDLPDDSLAGPTILNAMAASMAAIPGRLARQGVGAQAMESPRLLIFGETDSVRGLLTTAFRESPIPAPPQDTTDQPAWWRWWLGERVTAVEMAPALLADPTNPAYWDLTEAALGLLAKNRWDRPADGLVLAVPADRMVADPNIIGNATARLRAIGAEMKATLGWCVPLHFVVTGLQTIPGHDTFFKALPPSAGDQPLGHRFDLRTGSSQSVVAWLAALTNRLRRLRTDLLLAGAAEAIGDEIFRFAEGMTALAPGLAAAAAAPPESPTLRGLYLTAPGSAAPHLAEVVDGFMAVDSQLAYCTR